MQRIDEKTKVVVEIPTREEIDRLQVGDLVLNCFGEQRKITSIHARGNNFIDGKAYICFYSEFGNSGSTVSGSYAEDQMVRTVALSRYYTSHELDIIEKNLQPKQLKKVQNAVDKILGR